VSLQKETQIKLEIVKTLIGIYSVREAKKWLKAHGAGIGETTYYRYAKAYVDSYVGESLGPELTVWLFVNPRKYFKARLEAEEKALQLLEKLKALRGKYAKKTEAT